MTNHTWKAAVPYFGANVLFGAGLWIHAFLYNFYLQALGYEEAVMGLAAAALTGGGLTALVPAGLAVDRFGPRRTYLAAVVAASAGLLAGAFAESVWLLYAAAFVAGLGVATWRVTMGPVLMGLVGGNDRARAFSWNVALLVGSGAVWTALGGGATGWIGADGSLGGLRWTLAGGALVTACAGPAFMLVATRDAAASAEDRRSWRGVLRGLAIPGPLLALVAAVFLWMSAGGFVLPFFNIFFQRTYGLSIGAVGTLFALVQIVTAAVLLGAGELSGRRGPRTALVGWSLTMAPALALLVLGGPLAFAVAIYALAGIVPPATNPLIDQIILEEAHEAEHGAVSSWRNGATELSGFLGASVGGFILEAAGFRGLFGSAALLAALGAGALWLWLRRNPA